MFISKHLLNGDLKMSFEQTIVNAFGKKGEEWLQHLPMLIAEITERHELTKFTPVTNMSYNYVASAEQDGHEVIVKIGLPGFDFQNEMQTIQALAGTSLPELYDTNSNQGYYIMEKKSPGMMLHAEITDERTRVRVMANKWRELHQNPNISIDQTTFPHIRNWFSVCDNSFEEVPQQWLDQALRYADELNRLNEDQLLHGDLHHENILSDTNHEWSIIDPKGVIGHPYYDVVQYVLNKNESVTDMANKIVWIQQELEFYQDTYIKALKALGTVYLAWAIEDQASDWQQTYQWMSYIWELGEE